MPALCSQIRQLVIARLSASPELSAANIQAESKELYSLQELPVLSVKLDKAVILTDWSALDSQGQLLEMIEQPIVVKITVADNSGLDERLEQMAAQVSQVLAQNETLGGLIKSLRLEEDTELSISHEGEQPIGVLTMRFIALYRRQALQLNTTCN